MKKLKKQYVLISGSIVLPTMVWRRRRLWAWCRNKLIPLATIFTRYCLQFTVPCPKIMFLNIKGKIVHHIILNQILIGYDSNVAYLFWNVTYVWHFLEADSSVKCWQNRSSKTWQGVEMMHQIPSLFHWPHQHLKKTIIL